MSSHTRLSTIKYVFISILAFVLLTGCHSSKHVTKRHNKPNFETNTSLRNLDSKRRDLVEESLSWLGVPYKYGGNSKKEGVDCSGMVLQVYLSCTGIKLPRNSAKQAEFCKKLKEKDVRPGDLVFFATGKNPDVISHVGVMIDNDRFIHSSTSKGVVVSDVRSPYYERTFRQFGRVPGF